MQVKGVERKETVVTVEINPKEVVDKIKQKWLEKLKLPDHYINSDGHWEHWIDTHGSGITTVGREATDEEKEIYASLKVVHKLAEH